jgi:small subunit ribosomal protein S1
MANVEQTKDLTTEEQAEAGYIMDADGNLVPDYEQTIIIFDDGDIVSGQVVKIDRDEILVDIGYKSEGVIPIRELSIRKEVNPSDVVSLGEQVDALVLQKEDKDGRLILSKKRAEYEKSWIRIEQLSRSDEIVSGKVIEVVKGGLILDIGLRGFLPASLVDVRRVKDLHQFIGQALECKVIEMDRNRNNVVLSRRSVIDEARKQEREKVITSLTKGDILTGKVSSVVDFGAFVDLGGIDGLIHISEMSWTHIDHPSEVLELAGEVKVKVLDIDQERGRISLGLKQCQDDPWKQKTQDLKIGDKIDGRVCKLVPFGAFVTIADGVEGLVHISELADGHVELPEQAVTVGEQVCAKIVDIDSDRRRVSLSIRQAADSFDDGSGETGEEELAADTAKEIKPPAAVKKATVKKKTKPVETKIEDEIILESGDSALAAQALSLADLDTETSRAIGEALKRRKRATTKADEIAQLDQSEVEVAPEGDAGSFEDVLEKIKQTRGSKE